jgi:hypothetical protein
VKHLIIINRPACNILLTEEMHTLLSKMGAVWGTPLEASRRFVAGDSDTTIVTQTDDPALIDAWKVLGTFVGGVSVVNAPFFPEPFESTPGSRRISKLLVIREEGLTVVQSRLLEDLGDLLNVPVVRTREVMSRIVRPSGEDSGRVHVAITDCPAVVADMAAEAGIPCEVVR